MDNVDRIIAEINKCSPASTNSKGEVIHVYLGTESIGIIIANALDLRSDLKRAESEAKRLRDYISRSEIGESD